MSGYSFKSFLSNAFVKVTLYLGCCLSRFILVYHRSKLTANFVDCFIMVCM